MGRRVEYTRRKRDRACYNAAAAEISHFVSNCACADRDWECDRGYSRVPLDGGVCTRESVSDAMCSRSRSRASLPSSACSIDWLEAPPAAAAAAAGRPAELTPLAGVFCMKKRGMSTSEG
jgi:hypothetical protein